ncbi:hypothetical protein TRFO_12081 [Tritrichomonas foetus]|uniref:Uncharacterized protein n=1 Tax=Tritrichomonas foetus TaxID=1144522 RepID=A0A1J4J0E8_9EUKA|nr:hypothetical protein TRFO_12081 [Tritrichomonas foetus]|eukprot:OHS93064.1 hypothetical protein TRFO_12081 [Tritrichomonas foetus]
MFLLLLFFFHRKSQAISLCFDPLGSQCGTYNFQTDDDLWEFLKANSFRTVDIIVNCNDSSLFSASFEKTFPNENIQSVTFMNYHGKPSNFTFEVTENHFQTRNLYFSSTNVVLKPMKTDSFFALSLFAIMYSNFYIDDSFIELTRVDSKENNDLKNDSNHYKFPSSENYFKNNLKDYRPVVIQANGIYFIESNLKPISNYTKIIVQELEVDYATLLLSESILFSGDSEYYYGSVTFENFYLPSRNDSFSVIFDLNDSFSLHYDGKLLATCINFIDYFLEFNNIFGNIIFEGSSSTSYEVSVFSQDQAGVHLNLVDKSIIFNYIFLHIGHLNITCEHYIDKISFSGDNNLLETTVNLIINDYIELIDANVTVLSKKPRQLITLQTLKIRYANLYYEGDLDGLKFRIYEIVISNSYVEPNFYSTIYSPVILLKRIIVGTIDVHFTDLTFLTKNVGIAVDLYMETIAREYENLRPIYVNNLYCEGFTIAYIYSYDSDYFEFLYFFISVRYLGIYKSILVGENTKLSQIEIKYGDEFCQDYSSKLFILESNTKINYTIVNNTLMTAIAYESTEKHLSICITDDKEKCPLFAYYYYVYESNMWQTLVGNDTIQVKIIFRYDNLSIDLSMLNSMYSYIFEGDQKYNVNIILGENNLLELDQFSIENITLNVENHPNETTIEVANFSIKNVCEDYYNSPIQIRKFTSLYIDHQQMINCSHYINNNTNGNTYITGIDDAQLINFTKKGIQITKLGSESDEYTKSDFKDQFSKTKFIPKIVENGLNLNNNNIKNNQSNDISDFDFSNITVPPSDYYIVPYFHQLSNQNYSLAIEWPSVFLEHQQFYIACTSNSPFNDKFTMKIMPKTTSAIEILNEMPKNIYVELNSNHPDVFLICNSQRIPVKFFFHRKDEYNLHLIGSERGNYSNLIIDTNLSISRATNFTIHVSGNIQRIDILNPIQISGGTFGTNQENTVIIHKLILNDGGLELTSIKGMTINEAIVMNPGSFLQMMQSRFNNTEIFYYFDVDNYPSKIYANVTNTPKKLILHHSGSVSSPSDSRKWFIVSENPIFCVDMSSKIDLTKIAIQIDTPTFSMGNTEFDIHTTIGEYQEKRCITLQRTNHFILANSAIIGIVCGSALSIIFIIFFYRRCTSTK